MENQVTHLKTADGSSTLCSSKFGVTYHSLNGAKTESEHIFINAGLRKLSLQQINLLEVGFGTGLNAGLTAQEAAEKKLFINYHTLDLYPLSARDLSLLNYTEILPQSTAKLWLEICRTSWDKEVDISKNFTLLKLHVDFTLWQPEVKYNIVYFDAFAPDDQPEMWSKKMFEKLYTSMESDGILVTYCVKGIVKSLLTQIGFKIERLPGPLGKRHILRATKP